MSTSDSAVEQLMRSHITAETAMWEKLDARLGDLTAASIVLKTQVPELITELRSLGERADMVEREIALLKPLQEAVKDHELRIRSAESSALKLSTQAALIAALIGSALPLVFKLLGN